MDFPQLSHLPFGHWAFPLAAAPFIGSFLALLAVRLPLGKPLLIGRSACPACNRRLQPLDLVPLLSWLVLRGRCRSCGAAIAGFYPAMELASLVVALWAATLFSGWLLWASCLLGWSLLALAAIDRRDGILPDVLTLPLLLAGLAVIAGLDAARMPAHIVGAVAGFLGFAGLAVIYQRVRGRDGLGLGDAKLLAAAGAWLSWEGLPSVVLLAAVSALAVALLRSAGGQALRADRRIAFGPYLSLAIWLVWLYGPLVIGG